MSFPAGPGGAFGLGTTKGHSNGRRGMKEQDKGETPLRRNQTRLDKLFTRNSPPESALVSQASPHKVALLVMSLLGGLVGLILPGATSKSVDQSFVSVPALLFYAALALPSAISLLGLWKRGVDGLFLERVGLIGLTFTCAAYTVAVVGVAGYGGITASIFFIAFAVANVLRINVINRELLNLRRSLRTWDSTRLDMEEGR